MRSPAAPARHGSHARSRLNPLDLRSTSCALQLASRTKAGETPRGDAPPSGAGMMERAAWIIKHKGFMELYRGLYATLVTLGSSNFIYCAGPPGAFKWPSRSAAFTIANTCWYGAFVWARRTLNRSFRRLPAPRAVYWYNGFKAFVRLRSGRPTIGPLLNLVVASAAGLMTQGSRGSQGTPSHPLPDPGRPPRAH